MMRTHCLNLMMAVAALCSGALAVYCQQPGPKSDEFRKKFLESFHRTGLSTTPGDAMMLRILVESRSARRGVEVGVAAGFGAINMGIGFERTGGHLYSLEIDPKRAEESRQNIHKVALDKTVTVMLGDALELIPKLQGEFDFVFIDANKRDYMKYLKAIEPKLKRGAVVVADNVIKSARAMPDYLEYVQKNPAYETVIIRASEEKSDGMAVSYKLR
ncbi:MAG: class I SAM-dependent methyltransferase [Acidobacteria bacterium]|nr:class I SAM-dependent methyltransferase [Acidobacteriota bacterium]